MLKVEIEVEPIIELFESMEEKVKNFGNDDMPQGLTDWQVEDMHRKFPETATDQLGEDEYNASTMIYPRSRTYSQTHPYEHRPPHVNHHVVAHRAKPALSSMPRLIKTAISHPILRPVLFDMLYSRMVALISEKIKWQ